MRKALIIISAILCAMAQGCSQQDEVAMLNSQAAREYLKPIRPASEGRNPCWNAYSRKFTYAPAFEIEPVDGASGYLFTVTRQDGAGRWSFTAKEPTADLSAIWADITPSMVDLAVIALDAQGTPSDTVYKRSFLRDFPFEGPYNSNVRPYREAAIMAALYIHNSKATQSWITDTLPDMSYTHYTYPNKIIGGLISIESKIARLVPAKREEALAIARNAAKFLISESRPEGDRLEYFPPTYYKDLVASKFSWNIGKTMTMDACYAGNAFLDLYDVTRDSLYLDRAIKIADTYAKIQNEDGSFPIKVDFATGEPVNEVCAMLHPVMNYLRRLTSDYGADHYGETLGKAERWMKEVALERFDLTGQFEDVNIADVHPYENLTNCTACPYASYILRSNPGPADIEDARDLIRMSEDQFVHWNSIPDKNGIRDICAPCVYEQHRYQMPVDNSSCNVANAYLDLYEQTGDKLAYAKAKALIDNLTVVQDPTDGKIPTVWRFLNPEKSRNRTFWYNCTNSSITALLRMAEMTGEMDDQLRRITLDDIQYSHMGQLAIDKKGNCYASFLQNYGTGNERLRSETSEVTLACFPLERALAKDFSPARDVKFHRIGGLGDSFLGYTAASIFKDNSMCMEGDVIHITFQFLPSTDDIAHLFKTDYNVKTGTFSGEEECMVSYRGVQEPFTIKALSRIIESEGGVPPQIEDNILELVSQWSSYKGWWYASLACAGKTGSNGIIVRTRDFKVMEFVAMPPFNQDGMAETSSIIKDGRMYVACRQNYGIFRLLLSYYDLRKGEWGPVTTIPDGNSRPWFFIRKGKLYLMNTPDKPRRYINVSELSLDPDSAIAVRQIATLQDCGYYYAVASHKDQLYMVVTHNTESFGPLNLW